MYLCIYLCVRVCECVCLLCVVYTYIWIYIYIYMYISIYIEYLINNNTYIWIYYLHMYARMHVNPSARVESVAACVRALVHEFECVCARAAGAAAQPDRATSRCDSPCGYAYV